MTYLLDRARASLTTTNIAYARGVFVGIAAAMLGIFGGIIITGPLRPITPLIFGLIAVVAVLWLDHQQKARTGGVSA